MQLRPATQSAEKIYAASRLSEPAAFEDFDQLCERFRLFSRTSLLNFGSRILWHVHQNPDLLREKVQAGDQLAQIVWQHAPGAIGIASVCCSDDTLVAASEADFWALTYELFMCGTYNGVPEEPELALLTATLGQLAGRTESRRLGLLSTSDLRVIRAASFLARISRLQRASTRSTSREMRAVAVYRLMHSIVESGKGFEAAQVRAVFERTERSVLRTDYVHYLRAMMLFRHLAGETAKAPLDSHDCPGMMLLDKNGTIGDDWGETRWSDLLVTSERLAAPLDELEKSAVRLSDRSRADRPLSDDVWVLR